jgi:hypothetical protein
MDWERAVQEATPFSLSDFLLPKSWEVRCAKTPLIIALSITIWVIKGTEILPKSGHQSILGREDDNGIESWRRG